MSSIFAQIGIVLAIWNLELFFIMFLEIPAIKRAIRRAKRRLSNKIRHLLWLEEKKDDKE